jgi:hypothetical protein
MVYSCTTYHCAECRKSHFDYDEARACEARHQVDRAVESVREKLAAIMSPEKIRAVIKGKDHAH